MNIVVSGAGSVLGEKLCLHLSGNGHRVFALARNAARLASLAARRRGRIVPISADITCPEQVQQAYETVCAYGAIDALVNACHTVSTGPWTGDAQAADNAMDAAAQGATHCIRLILPHMLKHHAGRIVNITPLPIAGSIAGPGGVAAYADDLSRELQPQGIIASTLCAAQLGVPAWDDNALAWPDIRPEFHLDELLQMLEFLLTRPAAMVYQRLAVVPRALWQ